MEKLDPSIEREISSHEFAENNFNGFNVKVKEIAIYLLEKSIPLVRQNSSYKNKTQRDLLSEDINSFLAKLTGESVNLAGVNIPLIGPRITLKRERPGEYRIIDQEIFYLSAVTQGILNEKPGAESYEKTIEILKEEIDSQLTKIRSVSRYKDTPSYKDLNITWTRMIFDKHSDCIWADIVLPNGFKISLRDNINLGLSIYEIKRQAKNIANSAAFYFFEYDDIKFHEKEILCSFKNRTENLLKVENLIVTHVSVDFEASSLFRLNYIKYELFYNTITNYLEETTLRIVFHHDNADRRHNFFNEIERQIPDIKNRNRKQGVTVDIAAIRHAIETKREEDLLSIMKPKSRYPKSDIYSISNGHVSLSVYLDQDQKIKYENGILRIRDIEIPDAFFSAFKKCEIERLIEIPILSGYTIKRSRKLKNQNAFYLEKNEVPLEEGLKMLPTYSN